MKGKDKKIIAKLEQKSEIMSKKINNALYDFIEAFPAELEEDYRIRDMAVFKVFTNIVPIILDAGYDSRIKKVSLLRDSSEISSNVRGSFELSSIISVFSEDIS